MTAAKIDFVRNCIDSELIFGSCEQGATFDKIIKWKNPDGTPINLTGFTARMQIRKYIASPDIVHSMTTENGGIILTPESGTIELQISSEITKTFIPAIYVYDLELQLSTRVTRLIEGKFEVSAEVTR